MRHATKSRPKAKKPRNYLSRREEWRLLLLVMSLGLVALLMMEASNPKNYAWLWPAGEEDADPATLPERPADAPPIDDVVPPKPPSKVPGTFYSPAPVDPNAEEDSSGEYYPGVKPKLLEAVRDDTTFRNDERHAWFNLIDVLQKSSQEELEKGSLGRVSYFQLFEQTDEYRGKLVTIRGRVRRAHWLRAPKNDVGLERYCQLWFQPDDAKEYPMVVYCLDLPEGFPTGMKIAASAEITGFYFKRWAYKAPNALRTAPTLVAKTVRWTKEPPAETRSGEMGIGSLAIVAVAAAAFAACVVMFIHSRTRCGTGTMPRPDTVAGGPAGSATERSAGTSADHQDESHVD